MKTMQQVITQQVFRSEVMPEVQTTVPALSGPIAWADAHPVVWKVVTGRRSKAFGLGSCVYIGWAQRSNTPDAVLERVRHIHEVLERTRPYYTPDSIFVWRAKFTLDHFQDKGFTGGFFQQHDARYPRSCMTLDYTPETFEEVLDRFCAWMDKFYKTVRITVDSKTVRTFPHDRQEENE